MPIYDPSHTDNLLHNAVQKRISFNVACPRTGGIIYSFENDEGHTIELGSCASSVEFMNVIIPYIQNIVENL